MNIHMSSMKLNSFNMIRGENVSLTMLVKICDALHVNLGDIAEFVNE